LDAHEFKQILGRRLLASGMSTQPRQAMSLLSQQEIYSANTLDDPRNSPRSRTSNAAPVMLAQRVFIYGKKKTTQRLQNESHQGASHSISVPWTARYYARR
jgi:hypothetical protein